MKQQIRKKLLALAILHHQRKHHQKQRCGTTAPTVIVEKEEVVVVAKEEEIQLDKILKQVETIEKDHEAEDKVAAAIAAAIAKKLQLVNQDAHLFH